MKYILRLIAIILLIQWLMWSYTTSFSTSTWITYENDSNLKWCRYLSTTTSGYGWDASDSSSACGGNLNYRCSSDSAKLPQNSKKLLWPEDSTNWNSQIFIIIES